MKNITAIGMALALFLGGCSAAQKARKDERERVAQAKGVFCDFVSESDFKDVDIELNLRIAKRCDSNKPFSISGYKRISENPGIIYCCNTGGAIESEAPVSKAAPASSTNNSSGKQGE